MIHGLKFLSRRIVGYNYALTYIVKIRKLNTESKNNGGYDNFYSKQIYSTTGVVRCP